MACQNLPEEPAEGMMERGEISETAKKIAENVINVFEEKMLESTLPSHMRQFISRVEKECADALLTNTPPENIIAALKIRKDTIGRELWNCLSIAMQGKSDQNLVEKSKQLQYLSEFIEKKMIEVRQCIQAKAPIEAVPPETPQPPAQGEAEVPILTDTKLPPVIQAILEEGLLNESPVNGKYQKRGDKNDKKIIEWVFYFSGYGESLTTDLYMQYIQTQCKPTTIQDYITRKKKTPD